MKKIIIIFIVLMAISLLASCKGIGDSKEEKEASLVGRWTTTDSRGVTPYFILSEGGVGTTSVNNVGYSLDWSFTGDILNLTIENANPGSAYPDAGMLLNFSGGDTLEVLNINTSQPMGIFYHKQ